MKTTLHGPVITIDDPRAEVSGGSVRVTLDKTGQSFMCVYDRAENARLMAALANADALLARLEAESEVPALPQRIPEFIPAAVQAGPMTAHAAGRPGGGQPPVASHPYPAAGEDVPWSGEARASAVAESQGAGSEAGTGPVRAHAAGEPGSDRNSARGPALAEPLPPRRLEPPDALDLGRDGEGAMARLTEAWEADSGPALPDVWGEPDPGLP